MGDYNGSTGALVMTLDVDAALVARGHYQIRPLVHQWLHYLGEGHRDKRP